MLFYSSDCTRHVNAPGHVESPQRVEAIVTALEATKTWKDPVPPKPATRAQAEGVHRREYLDLIERMGDGYLDADTAVHPETMELAVLAAGGAIAAALACVQHGGPTFSIMRPPGHHAGPDYGGGFCYLNNVAIAAKILLERLARVAILDIDAHHGNGTQDVFAANREVLYVSTHQRGLFPGTGPAEFVGEVPANGYTVNIPLPAGAGDASFDLAFAEVIEPIITQFRPEAILVSFGGDAHYMDPLTSLALSTPGYLNLSERTLRLARSVAHGRVAFVLEGGYHLAALAEVVAGTCALFGGESILVRFKDKRDDGGVGAEAVAKSREVQSEYWDL